jgi:lysophospholipase L1-like esterase
MLIFYFFTIVSWVLLLIIALTWRKTRIGKLIKYIVIIVALFLIVEGSALIGFYITTGKWLFKEGTNPNQLLFEPHPYLIGVPIKNVHLTHKSITYSHNSQGFRGKEISPKSFKIRIIAIGGSTTYGTSVSDNQTWCYYLDSLLKPDYEVLNFGIPGHSSVEHIILSSLIIPQYKPDIVLIHTGMNDLRNMNIKDLKPDYSNFQAPSLYGSFAFRYDNNLPPSSTLKLIIMLLEKIGFYPISPYHKMKVEPLKNSGIDTVALNLYKRNLQTLDAIYKNMGAKVIFVPQIMVYDAFKGGKLSWWIPYVPEEMLVKDLGIYNAVMKTISDKNNSLYVKQITDYPWKKENFADPSHLNPKGNEMFATILAKAIKDNTIKYSYKR